MKSKCEKAANIFANKYKGEGLASEVIREHRRIGVVKGAEALLRYARSKETLMEGAESHAVVLISDLEEWVKGEK